MNEKTVQISSRYFPKYFAVGQIVGETHASPDWLRLHSPSFRSSYSAHSRPLSREKNHDPG